MYEKKKIVFLTGTRADFGKIKSLILGFQKKKNLGSVFCYWYAFIKNTDLLFMK